MERKCLQMVSGFIQWIKLRIKEEHGNVPRRQTFEIEMERLIEI